MWAHRNTSTGVLGAVVVAALTALASACGSSSPFQQPTGEQGAPAVTAHPGGTPPQKERMGTGSALGESIPPPAAPLPDAGPRKDRTHPEAGSPPAPEPKK